LSTKNFVGYRVEAGTVFMRNGSLEQEEGSTILEWSRKPVQEIPPDGERRCQISLVHIA
jgi:hypothetical protein